MDDEKDKTYLLALYEKLKRERQGNGQAAVIAAFEADTLPPGHLRNTRGFEPT